MTQKELKIEACESAYKLTCILLRIQDQDFVDSVIGAVCDGDEIMLAELMEDEQ